MVVQPGARVVTADNVGVHGALTNGGVTQQTRMIYNPWAFKFDLTGVVVTATATSGPTAMQVERYEENHPDATGNVRTGRYWAISATGGGYTVALTLPHTGLADPFVCGYSGADWECARTTFDAAHVTLAGVTNFAAFSAWAVGNAADAPKGSYLPTIMKSAD